MLIKRLILTALSAVPFALMAQVDSLRHEVLLQTNKGDIRLVLYNETPRHRDNFLKLVRSGYYNGNLFHRVIRGVLAAAREPDQTNPEHASSASQFYIVYGKRMSEDMLDRAQSRLDMATHDKIKLTPEIRKAYFEQGGTPHLDGQYTVFGEVVEGIDTIKNIQQVETDANDRPIEDIRILKATVVK